MNSLNLTAWLTFQFWRPMWDIQYSTFWRPTWGANYYEHKLLVTIMNDSLNVFIPLLYYIYKENLVINLKTKDCNEGYRILLELF